MKKNIYASILAGLAILFFFKANAQTYVELSYGRSLIDFTTYSSGNLMEINYENASYIDFQIGKFVNNRTARSLSINYHTGVTSKEIITSEFNNSNGLQTKKSFINSSFINIAYERKKTMFKTEFDDIWNIYRTIYIGFSLRSSNEDIISNTDPNAQYEEQLTGSGIGLYFGGGMGFARKINYSNYLFSDIRYLFHGDINNSSRLNMLVNFGARHFF